MFLSTGSMTWNNVSRCDAVSRPRGLSDNSVCRLVGDRQYARQSLEAVSDLESQRSYARQSVVFGVGPPSGDGSYIRS